MSPKLYSKEERKALESADADLDTIILEELGDIPKTSPFDNSADTFNSYSVIGEGEEA